MRALADLARAEEEIARRGGELGRPLHVLSVATSTNDHAKRAAREGAPHGATWIAEEQTEGRGRQGRRWFGARGESLLFSVLARVKTTPRRLPPLALVAGLAVTEAVVRAGATAKMKWPNDVVAGKKKLAGVLVEAIPGALVIGVGVNVHTRAFPEELAERATSVALLATRPVDRAELLADILAAIDRDLGIAAARGLGVLHARVAAVDALRGARVGCEDREGRAEGIDVDGRLMVRRDDGVLERWSAGEVHVTRVE